MNIIDTIHIQASDLWSFLIDYDKAREQGYERSELNEHFPIAMPSLYVAVLVKYEAVAQKETADVAEEAPKEPSAQAIAKQELLEKVGEDQVGAAIIPEEPVVGKNRTGRRK